jgi:hypothetical protein
MTILRVGLSQPIVGEMKPMMILVCFGVYIILETVSANSKLIRICSF